MSYDITVTERLTDGLFGVVCGVPCRVEGFSAQARAVGIGEGAGDSGSWVDLIYCTSTDTSIYDKYEYQYIVLA